MTRHPSTARCCVCALALLALSVGGARAQTVYFSNSSSAAPHSKTWNGSAWSVATILPTINKSSDAAWIQAAASPSQTEIVVGVSNPNPHRAKYVMFNTGGGFGTPTQISANSTDTAAREFAVAHEQLSGDCMLVYSPESDAVFTAQPAVAGALGSATTVITPGGNPCAARLYPKSGSDEILLLAVDSAKDLFARVWSGSSWASTLEVCTDCGVNDRRAFDVAYSPDGSKALLVYSNNSTTPVYRTYSSGSWSAAVNMSSLGATQPQVVQLKPWGTAGDIWVLMSDSGRDLDAWKWNGSSMGAKSTIETSLGGSLDKEQFWMPGPATVASLKIVNWAEVDP